MQKPPVKSNAKVSALAANLYAQWRAEQFSLPALRETEAAATPPERLLQQIWFHQRLQREALRTLDGQPVSVLHPGFWNREAGPDFREAIIQIGADAPRAGDVELDLRPESWRQHGHHQNPAYQRVLLHVIWEGPTAAHTVLPTVAIKDRLDAPLAELQLWLGGLGEAETPAHQTGLCSAALRGLSSDALADLLVQAARTRLESKAAHLEARARQAGWEQALWEGLFAALGYKHNVWPMRRLAELLPRLRTGIQSSDRPALLGQARLLGTSGLLPHDLGRPRTAADRYLREVWDLWWREREAFIDSLLPRAAWRLHGLRPANHPQRRLALAARWLTRENWIAGLEAWLREDQPSGALVASLLARLQVEDDPFWSHHWTLRSDRMPRPQPLLGAHRVTDLAVNVILPWFWIRAQAGKNAAMQAAVERRYFAWPAAQDNSVLRRARLRLLGGSTPRLPRLAALQQGLIQMVRDFCDHSDALCRECRLPELVRGIGGGA